MPYAHVKHAVLGSVLQMAVECSMTSEDLKKAFIFLEKEPYIEFNVPEKYQDVFNDFLEWVNIYVASLSKLDFLQAELEKIP